VRLAADENFNGHIVRGILRRRPDLDLVRVQDTQMYRAEDPELLTWAAREGRVVLTHDTGTMTRFAYERIAAGLPLPGVFRVPRDLELAEPSRTSSS
jgi:predicted nuclease of predicted toxin-antitoxin system